LKASILFSVRPTPEGMVKLNPSAGEILNLVDGKNTVLDVITSLKDKFKDAGDIDKDIISMFEFALEKAWITKD
jgi:pyrroloquinoline quinone biosynthesis protein D